ncbi:helicase-related protein [Oxalobacter paraformigenes]|uniref:ADP-ribosyltransferase-containing protein n=1 Tax=Oxalobacter paraformigenes TaxID=556268 RepID=UPI0002D94E17|nr:helicase-related protein [Oxalobacter paraformigenes]
MPELHKAICEIPDDTLLKGGKGSGNFGHAGRLGKVGGSSAGHGISRVTDESEKQYREIEAKYKGTNAWMKAPNGKPTKLTERQWVQVRTHNFKRWFGDWENDPDNASKVVDENGEPLVVYHGTEAGTRNERVRKTPSPEYFEKAREIYRQFGEKYEALRAGRDWSELNRDEKFISESHALVEWRESEIAKLEREYPAVEVREIIEREPIQVFDKKRLGQNTEGNASNFGLTGTAYTGFWFNVGGDVTMVGNNVISLFLKIVNPHDTGTLDDLAGDISATGKKTAKAAAKAYLETLRYGKYDGLVLEDTEIGGTSYVAFRPNQIKSATDNPGAFSANDPSIIKSYADVLSPEGNLLASGCLIKESFMKKALEEGERWVTVHPNGDGAKGVPVLIREHPDGTATVIGGAGGKLNHLKLRGIKPESDYKEALRQKEEDRKAARKQQIEADKASGMHALKVAERKKLQERMKSERAEFVQSVAKLAGWKPEELDFDEEKHAGLSPNALEKARSDHEKALFRKAKETVDINRKRLIEDAEARAQAGLGEVPLHSSSPDSLSVQDIAPLPEINASKLGFNPEYQSRSGISADQAKQEGALFLSHPDSDDQNSKDVKSDLKESINKEISEFTLNNPDSVLPKPRILEDAQKAADLLRSYKRLKMVEATAKDAQRKLDTADKVESKAQIIEVSDADVDEKTRQDIEQSVRTAGARSFLDELNRRGGELHLAGHVASGAFNALNGAALAIGGDALIDRSVVDVLGVSGAAQVLARRIYNDMAADTDKVRQAMEEYHVSRSDELQKTALDKARQYYDIASSIELPEASDGFDLVMAQEANHKRRQAVSEAQKILGQAHGEMTATASLVAALQRKPTDPIEVNMGALPADAAVTQLRAIGVQPGEYHLAKIGNSLVATISPEGLDNLSRPVDVEGMAQIRRNLDIMEGKYDEDGWLPKGFAKRPDLCMRVEPGVAEKLTEPFHPGENLQESLRDYIGSRMADGDAMQDIFADIQSSHFFQKSGDPDAYRDALDTVASLKDTNGKIRPLETLRHAWEKMADEFVQKRYGTSRAPIHRQTFDVDQTSCDALHRALSETPEGVLAYKAIGDLASGDRRNLKKWWENQSPGKSWSSFSALHDSPVQAFESVQHMIRSRIVKGFADAHNRLKTDAPLMVGRNNKLYTIGHAAEQKLAGMMSVVGKNFKPGQPVKLWQPTMSGGKAYARQRFLKLFEANKRIVGALGTGSGKTSLQLGGFTHLHEQGKAKRGLILAPSVVQAQFGGEALRYLEPGKYKWHADPGASRNQRLAALRDPSTHMVVATHQSFRDDMIHLGAKQAGISEQDMAKQLQTMSDDDRSAWAKGVMKKEGIDIDYLSVDESQYTLNRDGKENSRLANVVDAVAEHMPYYMLASADPVKNDASETYDLLRKMDRKRYADKGAFMRRYGRDAISAKDALKREMARYVYASKIDPDVKADRKEIAVPLNDSQKKSLSDLDKAVSEIRISAMEGKTATELVKKLCPEHFAGVPSTKHEEVAKALQKNAGLLRNAAIKRIINTSSTSAKLDKAAEIADARKGKPGVIFAHNLETVENLKKRLESSGHRVVALTGHDSTSEKDRKRLMFAPEKGEAKADILIASDAAATGLNLQRGQWLLQYDTADTAMVHAQRNGRIFRTGQKNDVELMDLVADHPAERAARDRLARKYELRELLTSPMEGLDDTGLAWYLRQRLGGAK